MSWAEVFKINNNVKKPLNELIRDMKCVPFRIVTTSTTYVPEKTGYYKIICVGAGASSVGNARSSADAFCIISGAGGGVAIKTMKLVKSTSYTISISGGASFGGTISATNASAGSVTGSGATITDSVAGTASGGDYNYTGLLGTKMYGYEPTTANGGSVGTFISELHSINTVTNGLLYGRGILEFGGGAPVSRTNNVTVTTYSGQPAAVIIVPIEMEE